MRALRSLLGLEETHSDDARDTATVRRIARELEDRPREEARYLAAFAYVLARVAHVDLDISETELEEMTKLVRSHGDMTEAQAALIVEIAKTEQVHLGGTENYVVTRQFRELSSREQRVKLLHCLFAVAAAEDSISAAESTEITRIAAELGFTRPEVAGIRSAFRDQLSVLRDLPGS